MPLCQPGIPPSMRTVAYNYKWVGQLRRSWPLLWPFALLFIYYCTGDFAEKRFFYENYILVGGSLQEATDDSETPACHLPLDLSPFDPSLQPYMTKLPSFVDCGQNKAADLTSVDQNGTLKMNKELSDGVECFYRCFDRENGSDSKVVYDSKILKVDPLNGSHLDCHFVRVNCNREKGKDSGAFYTNFHSWFATSEIRKETQRRKSIKMKIDVRESETIQRGSDSAESGSIVNLLE